MTKQVKPSDVFQVGKVRQTLNECAAALACPVQTLIGRLKRGKSIEEAVSEPVGSSTNKGKTFAVEVLTMDEMTRLLAACNDGATGARNRALIIVGWRSGLRMNEALSLCPKDIDRQSQTVRVLHGKGNKARTVGLDAQAWAVLDAWIERRATLPIDQAATIFCTLDGGRLQDCYVRNLMPRLAKAAGIEKRIHFHALRHTMAFELISEGVPLHLIQQQLGHSNAAITSRYINHLNPAETINRMKGRTWGHQANPIPIAVGTVPAPDWLPRLRADIGDRLAMFHDARTNQEEFRAIVILY